jgi:hypothetical protein
MHANHVVALIVKNVLLQVVIIAQMDFFQIFLTTVSHVHLTA